MIDGDSSPLGFFSRKLSDTETHYSTFDRELLAAFLAVKKWKHFVNSERLTLFTDHKPLVGALKNSKDRDSDRQQRQISFIIEYAADIFHIPGKDNVVADVLSQSMPSTIQSIEMDKNVELIDLVSIAKAQVNGDNDLTDFKFLKLTSLICTVKHHIQILGHLFQKS